MAKQQYQNDIDALLQARHPDPFGFLGLHPVGENGYLEARVFAPGATSVELLDAKTAKVISKLTPLNNSGIFVKATRRKKAFDYRLKITGNEWQHVVGDPFACSPLLGELDCHLLAEGTHGKPYQKLGSHLRTHDGLKGVSFVVWAPNASHVAVVGEFNQWDGRRHPMRFRHDCGMWEIFIPGLTAGVAYKYEIKDRHGNLLPLKADPFALQSEVRPNNASVIAKDPKHKWQDKAWMKTREQRNARDQAISIYEVHLGSWKRGDNNSFIDYRTLADDLVPYTKEMGFTHLQLMPVSEYPFDGSWGYQPVGLFGPTSRFGNAEDFQYFVDTCHKADIGLLIDWVPGHFPSDAHGLAQFDGTHLYEHADEKQGYHPDWNTLIYNYGRTEVANFLTASALHWLDRFHVDGVRVDAVASMLYLDYSREYGQWVPNQYGGNENLEAVEFLKNFNEALYREYPGAFSVAEESTSWPGVSRPTYDGGLGFGYKWNMGWMNDSLEYISKDPIHRKYHHNEMSFSLVYAFNENFILPLSHDEVVHGKGSILGRMPGDDWQRFANLRAYYGFMWTHPGKKLLFMGSEFAQSGEWNFDQSLDWHLLDYAPHQGVQQLIKDLNKVYKDHPALYQKDCEADGFCWLDHNNAEQSVFSYIRYGQDRSKPVVVVSNFTPTPHQNFRVGVPCAGHYREVLNTDAECYGGSNMGNLGGVHSENVGWNNQADSICITLPPLATVVFALS